MDARGEEHVMPLSNEYDNDTRGRIIYNLIIKKYSCARVYVIDIRVGTLKYMYSFTCASSK